MNPQRIAIKLFVTPDPTAEVQLEPFTSLFHEFIQKASVPGLLIDVADYAHVPNGPGIILIGHDVDYGLDAVGGRAGLLTVRKRYGAGGLGDIVRDTLAKAYSCARAIEEDGRTGVRFSPAVVELQILDRLAAPNDAETFEAASAELEPIFGELCGGVTIERTGGDDPRKPASLVIRSSADSDFASLLAKLGA